MSEAVPAAFRAHVRERAGGRCEYCLLHEDDAWKGIAGLVKRATQDVEDPLARLFGA